MTRLYLSLGTILLAAISLALILREPGSARRGSDPGLLPIQVSESAGSVVLEWNAQSPLVQSATRGSLEYIDGGVSHADDVDARVLRQGGLEYRRRSEDVVLRLILLKDRDVIGHASVRLTGSATAPGNETSR